MDVFAHDLAALSAAFEVGSLTAREVAESYIARIEAHDDKLHAFITRTFDAAMDEAAQSDERRAAGEAALKDAARAARHIGALAFYHDTRKSLEAYQEAVALDGADAEGWNELGHLRMRLGELDGAKMAYEKVLSLGNQSSDKGVIAVATGNRGLIY